MLQPQLLRLLVAPRLQLHVGQLDKGLAVEDSRESAVVEAQAKRLRISIVLHHNGRLPIARVAWLGEDDGVAEQRPHAAPDQLDTRDGKELVRQRTVVDEAQAERLRVSVVLHHNGLPPRVLVPRLGHLDAVPQLRSPRRARVVV